MKINGMRSIVEFAVAARTGSDAIYRSVSPWELEDVIRKGYVTGKGSWFSGDKARTRGRIWFGDTLSDVQDHGRDWRRYLESTDTFRRAFVLKNKIDIKRNEMNPPHDMSGFDRHYWPKWKSTLGTQLDKMFFKFQDTLFSQLNQILKRILKLQEKRAAGYVIEVVGVGGGTRYTGQDSLAGRQSRDAKESPPEIAMPVWDDPVIEKGARITTNHIARIHALNTKGKVTKVYERPSSGWRADQFGKKGVNAPDVQKALAAMDRSTSAAEKLLTGIETKIRRAS